MRQKNDFVWSLVWRSVYDSVWSPIYNWSRSSDTDYVSVGYLISDPVWELIGQSVYHSVSSSIWSSIDKLNEQ